MDTEEGPNLMSWLIDLAKGNDRKPDKIAHLQLLLSFASVHTALVRILNVLYDIMANPELVQVLEDEIHAVANSDTGWADVPYERLYKLDSVIRGSQRMSPPGAIGVKRLFQTQYTFQGGLNISKGTYVCLPALAIEHDPYFYPNPHAFNRLRSYRSYMQANEGGRETKCQPVSICHDRSDEYELRTRQEHLSWAVLCASLAVKMVMVKLLTEYDFKSLPGATRPSNLMFHESYLSRHCKRYWSGAKEKECARFSPRYCYNSNFLSHSLLRKPSRVIYDMLGQRTRRERQHQMKMVSRAGQYERTWFYNFLGTDGPSSLTASSCAGNRPVGTTR